MNVTLDNQVQAWLTVQGKTGNTPIDYLLVADETGQQIGFWDTNKLGPQPTPDQLAALSAQAQTIATTALLKQGEVAIQGWLDSTAQTYGFDSIISACSYRGSTNDLWNRQATAFASWRDAVWQAAEQQKAAVEVGTQQPPTSTADLIASLPQPSIPTT